MRGLTLCCLTAGPLLFSGCSPSEPIVKGVVRLNGELLQNGSIKFDPVDDKGAVAKGRGPGGGATIAEGQYRIEKGLTVGKYRVEIQGTRTLDRKRPNPTMPSHPVNEEVSIIPEEYNTKSSLVREVGPGSNVLDFELKGAAARR
jgi:hypothetical protein